MTARELARHDVALGRAQLPAHAAGPRRPLDEAYESPDRSLTRTADGLSAVCACEVLPGTVTGVGPFVAVTADGPLDRSVAVWTDAGDTVRREEHR